MNMDTPLPFDALLRFLAVVEAGSFSAAAKRLGVSRQAIHRSVEQLEQASGAPLLERGQTLRVTSLGKRLLPHARAVRDAGAAAQALCRAHQEGPTGLVRLTAPPIFGQAALPQVVARFMARWPAVRLEVWLDAARTALGRDDYDLMIRVGAPPDADSYAAPLGHAALCLCASPALLAELGEPEAPGVLSRWPLLEYAPRPSQRWWFERAAQRVAVEVEPRLSCNDASPLIAACEASLGALLIPAMAVAPQLERGQLVALLPEWQPPPSPIWALYGHRSGDDPTLAALLDALREVMADT